MALEQIRLPRSERIAHTLERLANDKSISKLDIMVLWLIHSRENSSLNSITVSWMASALSRTDRSIRRSLKNLQAVEALKVIPRKGYPNAYETFPAPDVTPDVQDVTPPGRMDVTPDTGAPSSRLFLEANASRAAAKPRRKDELFEALCTVGGHELGSLTGAERGRLNKARKELAGVGATAQDVLDRAAEYKRQHPEWDFTPMALVTHWSTLVPRKKKEVDDYELCGCGAARWQHDERLNNGIDHPFGDVDGAEA